MNDWIDRLHELRQGGDGIMLVTIAAVRGSAPREVGAKMIVSAGQTVGSIGGGQLEYQCTRIASERLRDRPAGLHFRRRFPLGSDLGQCCGGVVEVLFEPIDGNAGDWFDELRRCYLAREPVVMVTTGDDKFLVGADRVIEVSQSGASDRIVAEARNMLEERRYGARNADHGGMPVLYEAVADSGMDVAIFGAGHVGSACVAALAGIDCRIRWIDSRRKVFPDRLPANVMRVDTADPALEVAAMPPGAYYLVMTHSHPLDYDVCHRILLREDFAYCGLIGSLSKRRRFAKIMRQCGLPAAALERLTCPIGVAGIEGKRPEEIAIAVSAQLLQLRDAAQAAIPADRETWTHTLLTG